MGQARARRERILAEQPSCIYCGGTEPAVSIDHCPPTALFDGARRPKGLEFGACAECHEGTRQIDLVAAWLSRIYPDPTSDEGRAEARKHIRGLINNHPRLAASLDISNAPEMLYRGRTAHPIRIDAGSPIHRAMTAFAARFGMAMFFEHTGRVVPTSAIVAGVWRSNVQLDQDEGLGAALDAIGAPRTLAMGRQHVVEQFRYWPGIPEDDPRKFFCFAAFRESFGVIAMVDEAPQFGSTDDAEGFQAGFLRGFQI